MFDVQFVLEGRGVRKAEPFRTYFEELSGLLELLQLLAFHETYVFFMVGLHDQFAADFVDEELPVLLLDDRVVGLVVGNQREVVQELFESVTLAHELLVVELHDVHDLVGGESHSLVLVDEAEDRQITTTSAQLQGLALYLQIQILLEFGDIFGQAGAGIAVAGYSHLLVALVEHLFVLEQYF